MRTKNTIITINTYERTKNTIITSTVNALKKVEILDSFLIPSRENWFGDEVIFEEGDPFC